MSEYICPIMVLAASIEGLKPIEHHRAEEEAKCFEDKCAWWNKNQCAITEISFALP